MRRTAVSGAAVYAAENPDPIRDGHQQDRRLHLAISGLIHRFQNLAGRPFSDEQGLSDQLYIHLSQALDRSVLLSASITRCRRRLAVSIPA
jgi:transcriptional antiterminator